MLEDLEQAVGVFQHVLSVDDGDKNALDQLERLYIRLGRWNDLKNVYAKKAELATTPAEKKQMLFVLGQVYDRELDDPERAVETYSSIIDLDPEDYDAAQALDRLFVKTQRWYDLLAVLERQTELAPSPGEVVSLRFRIGELWREHLKDLGRAVEAYRQVLSMDPTHEPTVQALEALMTGKDEPVLAAAVLEPIYESAGEWDRVIAVYEVMQANSDDAVRTVELLSRIAEIEERRLSHQNAAFDVYGRALRIDPTNQDVLAHLERLAAETGHWAKLATLLASEIERIDEPRRAIELLLRLARVYEEETGQLEEAIATYRRAVAADPDSKAALVALDRLYGRAQQWEDLADVVRREIRIAPTDEDRVALTFRLAQIYELALVDMPKAVEAYREVLTADPTHAETRAALERMFMGGTMQLEIADVLEPLYRQGQEWEKLHQIYEVQLGRLTDVAERQTLLRRLAEIAEHKLVDQVAAFGWWAEAVKEDPSSAQALDELLRLARATHQWDAYVTTMIGRGVARADAGGPARRAAAARGQLRDRPRRPRAGGEGARAGAVRAREGSGRARLARSHLRQPGDVREPGRDPPPASVHHRRRRPSSSRSTSGSGAVYAEALDEVDFAIAELPRGARARVALARGPRGARTALLPQRALAGALRRLREDGRHRRRRDGDRRLPRAHGQARRHRARRPREGGRAVGQGRRRARRGRHRAVGARRSARDGERVEGADRGPREAGASRRPSPTPGSRSTSASAASGARSCRASATRSRAGRRCSRSIPQDVDALRAIAANYRSAGAWEELSQALRRLIQVGQLGGSGVESPELKELFAQLGELEGETLMRTQDSIDAWREVLELDRLRLPRAGGARAPVHAGGALGGGGRHPRAPRRGARQPDRAGRRPHAGGVAVGRQDRRRRLGGRGLRAGARRSIRATRPRRSSSNSSIASARAG